MRKLLLPAAFLAVFFVSVSMLADPLPVGTYSLSAFTPTSGIHSGSDLGTMNGTLVFDAASNLTFANLAFDDITTSRTFTFTDPGPVTIDGAGHVLYATIYNATDSNEYYQFSVRIPGLSDGTFSLNCGTDCATWMEVNNGSTPYTYIEVQGKITPTPEPSALVLLVTGVLGGASMLRRKLL